MQLPSPNRTKYNAHTVKKLTRDHLSMQYNDKFSVRQTTCICRINLQTNVYHVYAPNGLLIKRINFSSLRALYGTPVA